MNQKETEHKKGGSISTIGQGTNGRAEKKGYIPKKAQTTHRSKDIS